MPHFTKPPEGSWTEHYGLGTGPVSYEDSISPEYYELERDAIFRRTWLNVGRVEQLPKTGSYFTKELDGACTFVQQQAEFFDLDKADYALATVQADVWEGFIFVNLDPTNTTSLRE